MLLVLHEIELGSGNPDASKEFYHKSLGLPLAVDQDQLKVVRPNVDGLDFNLSTHLSAPRVIISFLTRDLEGVMDELKRQGRPFSGPRPSHLGMTSVQLEDPDGYTVKINMPTEGSPQWLKDKAARIGTAALVASGH
ncbi:VOC family protein [Flaviaesturariibacter amylovorans]